MQEDIAESKWGHGKDELHKQVDEDKKNADNGQQAFSMRQ